MEESFSLSRDAGTWVVTIVVTATVLLVMPSIMLAVGQTVMALIAFVGMSLFFLVLVFFAPMKYLVSPDGVTVWRWGPIFVIPSETISGAEEVRLSGVVRTCGVGGFLGAWGWFRARDIGSFRAYVSRSDRMVMIRRKDDVPVVLTPDDPQGLIEAVKVVLSGR